MATEFIIEQLKKKFKNRESFSRSELFAFYQKFEPDLKETTFRWRIYDLKQKKIISSLAVGVFSLKYKPNFKPQAEDTATKIFNKLQKQFPDLKYCIWSTKIINEFMLHIPGTFTTIIEVENDALEPAFDFLKESNFKNLYFEPQAKEMERYLSTTENGIILQSLVSKAPLQKVNKVATITIEKLIVDLYCDKTVLNTYQGTELIHIINNAYNRYAIDFTKLFSYAKRRGKEQDIKEFFSKKTNISKTLIND